MYKFFVIAAMFIIIPATVSGAEIVRGKVTSVQRCYPTGYALTLGGVATTTVITATTAIPAANTSVIALVGATTTCNTSSGSLTTLVTGKALSFILSSSPTPTPLPPSSLPSTSNNPGGTNAGSGGSAANPIQGAFNNFLNTAGSAAGTAASNAIGNAVGDAVGAGAFAASQAAAFSVPYFGGRVPFIIPCNGGIVFIPSLIGYPYTGPLMWVPPGGEPPYLHNLSAPPYPSQCITGHMQGAAACFIGHVFIGAGPVILNYGSTAGACVQGLGVLASLTPPLPTPSTNNGTPSVCGQYDQEAKNAIQKYGGNLMSGGVPGLAAFCPKYDSFTQQQRLDFWTNFVSAVEKPESSCQTGIQSYSPEPDLSSPSEGLLQLSYGDTAACHPDACRPLSGSYKQYDKNDPTQPIYDPQTNLNCGVAIMDCLSKNGITNNNAGMDAYWSVLRRGHKPLGNIQAAMASFPGCK